MTPAQWRLVNAAFDAAVDEPQEQWPAIVAAKCQGDGEVAQEALALLESHKLSTGFMARPVADLSPKSLLSRMNRLLTPVRTFAPGERVSDFEIVKLVGEGAFAKVYHARQLSLARGVALKVTPDVGREARMMAGLEHDHIVTVFSETVMEGVGMRLICMQFVQGATLQQLITKLAEVPEDKRTGDSILAVLDTYDDSGQTLFNAAAMRDREAMSRSEYHAACLYIGACLAEALAFAHARGILHLDVKPANILVNRYGRPMLTDFNVSLTPEDIESKDPAMLGGTLAYMSPEQHYVFTSKDMGRLATIDARSDLYSLGIVLTELLTCAKVEKSVDATTGVTVLRHTESLPEEIASVLHCAVRVAPAERFQNAREMAAALKNCHEVANIRLSLPNDGLIVQYAGRFPVMAIVFLAIGPQILGSAVNITYNSIRIVEDLTHEQQETFLRLLLPYNLLVYPIGIWLVWRQIAFLVKALRQRRDRYMPDPASMGTLRKRVLQTPYILVLASSVGWLPGAILFPLLIDMISGPLESDTYWHFFISFVSSWLIALTYSFLLLESVVLQVIYPRFWTSRCDIKAASRVELEKVIQRLKIFQVLAGIIPLAGAVMIVGAGPEVIDPERYYVFQVMVVGLISLGMCGFVFAMKATENIKRTVASFQGV